MFTKSQINKLNQVLSVTQSFLNHAEGKNVAVLKTESNDFHNLLISTGFCQDIRKDKFNTHYGHSLYWNDTTQLLISFTGNKLWTVANEDYVLTASSFDNLG